MYSVIASSLLTRSRPEVGGCVASPDGNSHARVNTRTRTLVFALLVTIQIFVNFDSGAIAASLGELQAKYGMSTSEAGLVCVCVHLSLPMTSAHGDNL